MNFKSLTQPLKLKILLSKRCSSMLVPLIHISWSRTFIWEPWPWIVCVSLGVCGAVSSFCCWQGGRVQSTALERSKHVKRTGVRCACSGWDGPPSRTSRGQQRKCVVCRSTSDVAAVPKFLGNKPESEAMEREAVFGIQIRFWGILHKSGFKLVTCWWLYWYSAKHKDRTVSSGGDGGRQTKKERQKSFYQVKVKVSLQTTRLISVLIYLFLYVYSIQTSLSYSKSNDVRPTHLQKQNTLKHYIWIPFYNVDH